jgi:hypothetical protein
MNGSENELLKQIYESVIRSEETIKTLKHNCEIQRQSDLDHEKRLNKLEIFKGRIKGIYATITTVVVISTGIVTIVLSKFLGK